MRPARRPVFGWRAGPAADARGYTVVEVLLVLAILAIVGAAAAPQLGAGVEHARTRAAARHLAAQLGMVRMQAVTRGTAVAVRFDIRPGGTTMDLVMDGNANGVRTQDIEAGLDLVIDRPAALEASFPGVRFALASDPDGTGIHLSGSTLLSFTPEGTSTSGSLYLLGRDGSQFAVRILGATGRVRTQRLDPRTNAWVDVL